MAYIETVDLNQDLPPIHNYVASFQHDGQYQLLWGWLIRDTGDTDFQYLYDSMLGLLDGMSFDR